MDHDTRELLDTAWANAETLGERERIEQQRQPQLLAAHTAYLDLIRRLPHDQVAVAYWLREIEEARTLARRGQETGRLWVGGWRDEQIIADVQSRCDIIGHPEYCCDTSDDSRRRRRYEQSVYSA